MVEDGGGRRRRDREAVLGGLVLLVQNTTDRFETWAYAWTVLVVGAGIGRWLGGITRGRRDLAAGCC